MALRVEKKATESLSTEWPYDDEPRFTRAILVRLAGVSPVLVRRLEERGWIRPKPMPGGGVGYSLRDLRLLIRVREWRDVLGLDMAAIEVALHLRQQILELQAEIARLEAEMAQRIAELNAEIQRLRRQLARDGEWFSER